VPPALNGLAQPGVRVLVPFRNKSIVGVIIEPVSEPPPATKIREIAKLLDTRPALTPKLIELALWIAKYYLAPVGEVLRTMLHPVTEVRTQRELRITEAGRGAGATLIGVELSYGLTQAEADLLGKLREKGVMRAEVASKLRLDAAALEKLRRQGLIEIRETVLGRAQ